MDNFSESADMRKNMVECQLETTNVTAPKVLDSFRSVPRELFVPEDKKHVAYVDDDIQIADGRVLLEPSLHARMVQALDLKPHEAVLDIGCTTGYSSAILSPLVKTVVALESNEDFLKQAKANWETLSLYNIASVTSSMSLCGQEHAPYTAIIINGAVSEIPEAALKALDVNGRLCCILKPKHDSIGNVVLVQKIDTQNTSRITLFETSTGYLEGFEPKKEFVF